MYRWLDKRYNWHLCYIKYLTQLYIYIISTHAQRILRSISSIFSATYQTFDTFKMVVLYIHNVTLESNMAEDFKR